MADTLLKWPGGKSREFALARPAIPLFTRYAEPFFGGGAFFFHLRPERAFLNDANPSLMGLYRGVKEGNVSFYDAITRYVTLWQQLGAVADVLQEPLTALYAAHRSSGRQLLTQVESCVDVSADACQSHLSGFFGDLSCLWRMIRASVVAKFARLPKLEMDNDVRFNNALMHDHVETAVRAGAYTYFRDRFTPGTEEEAVANFYFLREFCYGSMFRFNRDGRFNIPYGGIGYNRKDFRAKSARLFSPQTQSLFAGAELFQEDFRIFFEHIWAQLTPDTFCFLDPPYDTEFSAYDNLAFTRQDQADLAEIFLRLPCQSMLIIKATTFVWELYQQAQQKNPAIEIVDFEKTYTYNVRGRNVRDVQHLMICNYPITSVTSSKVQQLALL